MNETDSSEDGNEQSAFHVLARSPLWWKPLGIAFLAEQGANLSLRDTKGQTPLWCAVRSKATKNVEMLLGVARTRISQTTRALLA